MTGSDDTMRGNKRKGQASVRISFVKRFGEAQAKAIENAAQSHANGINDEKLGDDPFKWALLICIGYQCAEVESYRKDHGITAPWKNIKAWIKKYGELQSHNGSCDYLALFAGTYNEFMGKRSLSVKAGKASTDATLADK